MTIDGPGPARPVEPDPAHQALRRVSRELESVFLRQLLEVMRTEVFESELLGDREAERTYTALLDDRLAEEAAQHMTRGLGEALYRQLSRNLPPEE